MHKYALLQLGQQPVRSHLRRSHLRLHVHQILRSTTRRILRADSRASERGKRARRRWARSGRALAQLRALSEQLRSRGRRAQLKQARNDHACMLRLRVARSGNGRQRPVGGAGGRGGGARAAPRALARAAAVRAGRGRAGRALQAMTWSVIASAGILSWHRRRGSKSEVTAGPTGAAPVNGPLA